MPAASPRRTLRAFLKSSARPAGTLTYHELQGFLFTVASAPELIRPSEWLPVVFGEQDAGFTSVAEAQAILSQVMTLYNDVNAMVGTERTVLPRGCHFRRDILDNFDDSAPMAQWSRGFLIGHQWLEDLWNVDLPAPLDEELGAVLMTLSFFGSRDLAEAFRAEGGPPQRSLEESAATMRRVFRDALTEYAGLGRALGEVLAERGEQAPEPIRRTRIGRNDPCPCGSGKKFKRCCGATVH